MNDRQSIVQNVYNHGVIEYKIERKNKEYRVLSVGSKTIQLLSYINEHETECITIPHFHGDSIINGNKKLFLKLDSDFITLYNVPSSLMKRIKRYKMDSLNKNQKPLYNEVCLFYQVHPLVVDKLSNKSLKLKRTITLNCNVIVNQKRYARKHDVN